VCTSVRNLQSGLDEASIGGETEGVNRATMGIIKSWFQLLLLSGIQAIVMVLARGFVPQPWI
jgi:hypothetical protein